MRNLAARRICQTALRKFLEWVKERALPLVENVEINGALVANSKKNAVQLRAAVIQPIWVQKLLEVPPMSEGVAATRTCEQVMSVVLEGIAEQLILLNHPLMAASTVILLVILPASVRASVIEKERCCPTAFATSPVLVDRDRSFRNWSVYQNWNPRWVSLHGPALGSTSPQALDHEPNASQWNQHRSGARFLNNARSAETRSVVGDRRFEPQRLDQVPNKSRWSLHRSSTGSRHTARNLDTTSVTPFSPSFSPH